MNRFERSPMPFRSEFPPKSERKTEEQISRNSSESLPEEFYGQAEGKLEEPAQPTPELLELVDADDVNFAETNEVVQDQTEKTLDRIGSSTREKLAEDDKNEEYISTAQEFISAPKDIAVQIDAALSEPESLSSLTKSYWERFKGNLIDTMFEFQQGRVISGVGKYFKNIVGKNPLLVVGGGLDEAGYVLRRLGIKMGQAGKPEQGGGQSKKVAKPDSIKGIIEKYKEMYAQVKQRGGGFNFKRDLGEATGIQLELYGYVFRKLGKTIGRWG